MKQIKRQTKKRIIKHSEKGALVKGYLEKKDGDKCRKRDDDMTDPRQCFFADSNQRMHDNGNDGRLNAIK